MSTASPSGEEENAPWRLRLYILGRGPKSLAAIENINGICERFARATFHLEVIDVEESPSLAEKEQLLALPMLVRMSPSPVRRIIGDLSDPEATAVALNLRKLD